ncbi:zf-HC2 domain-containing protein [Pseudoxanthomonas sp. UTMC 1351]|uniref:zf-HC2 domain-containing protein n=1 Tax=Pseudoxanthomonas sp. UTMC 1351 TaxID=2695853 RepID=UPI0034CE7879
MKTFFVEPGQECSHAWELMPWVLQGSASEEQNDWLHTHLTQCNACSAEFAQQNRLRMAMSLPADVPVDAEAGLQRLLKQVDTPELRKAPARTQSSGWLVKALVATVLAQAIGLGVLSSQLLTANPAPTYRTLSDAPAPVAAGTVRVVPDPQMPLSDWNALLRTLQLQVVGGPNGMGAYIVAPIAPNAAAQTSQVVQQLRAAPGIRLAEPISSTP